MNEKKCIKCGDLKELSDYSKDKRNSDGLRKDCKKCKGIIDARYRENNKKAIKDSNMKWYWSNTEDISNRCKIKRNINLKEYNKKQREYYSKNKESIAISKKKYNDANRGKISIQCKEYRKNNKEKILKAQRDKWRDNPIHRLSMNIRCLINASLKNKGYSKKTKTYKILGCSWDEFKLHLENNPYGFEISDENIDLDHIIMCSSGITEEEVLKLNHYTNFQLLPSLYNRNVKRDNIWDEDNFKEWLEYNPSSEYWDCSKKSKPL